MNRVEFMRQLESLLRGIAPMERDEALQYYNDYFDDAGAENEQEVIEALGNPARVAENIRRDLLGNGYGEGAARKAKPSDRALVEYGKETQDADSGSEDPKSTFSGGAAYGRAGTGGAAYSEAGTGGAAYGGAAYSEAGTGGAAYGGAAYSGTGTGEAAYGGSPSGGGFGGAASTFYPTGRRKYAGKFRKRETNMPTWAIVLLVALLIFTSPVWLGLIMGGVGVLFGAAGTLLALAAAWFVMIFAFGAVVVAMLVMLVVLIVTGFMCYFTNPWVGMALIGSGLVCGAIGLLFLMLTVAMAGIATPAIFRGLKYLFRTLFGKKPAKGVN